MISLLQKYISRALEQQLPDVNNLSTSKLRPYLYTRLSDQPSFRLLEIIPSSGSQIQCRLEEFSLYNPPLYDALSYTWGDPRPPLFQSIGSSHFQKQHLIQCDSCEIYVTTNLYHALQQLRHEHLTSPAALQKYIWIDAVCINQQDLAERSAQVALMEEIYKRAQMVVAWLGKSDRYTNLALKSISRLAEHPPRPSRQYGSLAEKFPDISPKSWEALVAFFRREYFRRAWILQEVVCGRKTVFFIGEEKIGWDSVEKASRFIELTSTWKQLDIITSYFVSLSGRMEKQISPTGITIASLSQLKIKPRSFYSGNEIPWYTLTLPINIGRGFLATNKRDHFYSVLGVTKDIITSAPNIDKRIILELIDQLPVPDYKKSISTVFTDFAKWQLKVTKNLSLLFMVEDPSFRSSDLADCPSWVPDQSIAVRPMPLQIVGAHLSIWDPSLSDGTGQPIDSPDGCVLLLQGGIFDTITAVAEPFNHIIQDAEGLIGVLNIIKPLLGRKYPGSGKSYADILWRTLILDSHPIPGNSHAPRLSPARSSLSRAFNEWLITRSLFFPGSVIDKQNFETESYGKVSRLLLEGIWDQLHSDPLVFDSFSKDAQQKLAQYEEHERTIYQTRKAPRRTFKQGRDTLLRVLADMSKLDKSGVLFSPGKIKLTRIILGLSTTNKYKVELFGRKDAFLAATKNVIDDRRLVLTSKGYLGLAAKSVGVGDQVWVLKGPSTPFILRPLSNGKYRLMCETYIHGIMYGEAVKAGSVEFGDVELQ